jgi:hypothetical protein
MMTVAAGVGISDVALAKHCKKANIRERLKKLEEVLKSARALEHELPHLPAPNFTYSEENIVAEDESIELIDGAAKFACGYEGLLHGRFRVFFRPKKTRPFHCVPVMCLATADSRVRPKARCPPT